MTAALERVRVSQTLAGSSAFAAAVSRQVARKLAARLDQVGLDAVRRCDAIVAAELVNDRPANRRRGGRHLLGSFRHEVIWNGSTFPVSIRLFSLASPVKVNAMESGADPHPINAINGPTLVFPGFNLKSGKGAAASTFVGQLGDTKFSSVRGTSQIRQAYGNAGVLARPKKVDHPGNLPHSMMERALKAAVEAALSGARL